MQKVKKIINLDKNREYILEEKNYRIPNEYQLEVRELILNAVFKRGKYGN